MKKFKLLSFFIITACAVSCSSVRVASDYDEAVDFNTYKTYAYLKDGVDQAEISDLDKKRILRAIDTEMENKGFTKSDNPDLLINIVTKSRKDVNVNRWNGYYGMGWAPYWGWGSPWGWGAGYTSVSTQTEGVLYIDFIDSSKRELIWQGVGTGVITQNRNKKQELINKFVNKIMAEFPPEKDK